MINNCNGCGLCCRFFLINLSKEEYESGDCQTMFEEYGVMEDFEKAEECGVNFLAQKSDGSCIYLVENKCSIHDKRPKVCRDFFCTSKKKEFEGMVKIIREKDKEKISLVSKRQME